MDRVALGRVVLTSREHVIALEARDKGLMGMLLRYPYEARDCADYFDEIQDVKITKDIRPRQSAVPILRQIKGELDGRKWRRIRGGTLS